MSTLLLLTTLAFGSTSPPPSSGRVAVGAPESEETRTEFHKLMAHNELILLHRGAAIWVFDSLPVAARDRFADLTWVEDEEWFKASLRSRNDTCYALQWHLHSAASADSDTHIGAEDAWLISDGALAGGGAVRVAIVDDGVEFAHPDLRVVDAADFSGGHSGGAPDIGDKHGTQTAGLVAARADNNLGVVGVCPECELISVRLLGNGGPDDLFSVSSIAAALAIEWAVDAGADVINNSWGPPDGDPNVPQAERVYWPIPTALTAALRYAATSGRDGLGTVVVWSAGNGGELLTLDGYAASPLVVSVGSIDSTGLRPYYSDFGPALDLVAPSSDDERLLSLLTTDRLGPLGVNARSEVGCDESEPCSRACLEDYTDKFGGTSAAAALVSGVAALVIARYPTLTAAQVTEAMLDGAFSISQADARYVDGYSPYYGFGRVDAAGALEEAARYTDSLTFALEVCDNGIDDDGDGTIDNFNQCQTCTPSGSEICDGIDNDCDGSIDPLFTCVDSGRPFCAPCDRSIQCEAPLRCRSSSAYPGTYCFLPCESEADCAAGAHCENGSCTLASTPETRDCAAYFRTGEHCNGRDDNGNGLVDDVREGSPPQIAATLACRGAGVCRFTTVSCVDGQWRCDEPANFEGIETRCDGLDNDCDGSTDENCNAGRKGGGCAQVPMWLLPFLKARFNRRRRGNRK